MAPRACSTCSPSGSGGPPLPLWYSDGWTVTKRNLIKIKRSPDMLVVVFLRYDGFDQAEKGISRHGEPQIAWFTDPAGNIIAVLE